MTNPNLLFLQAFFKNVRNTGSIFPSSVYLAKKMARPISAKKNMNVVELGAGTGSITKYLLEFLPSDAKLFSIELNDELADHLESSIKDSRFNLIRGDASKLGDYLKQYNIEKVDYIISGIPLGNLPIGLRQSIYAEIINCLNPQGLYIQFQYGMTNIVEIKKHFIVDKITFEWRNIPPAFVYSCKLK